MKKILARLGQLALALSCWAAMLGLGHAQIYFTNSSRLATGYNWLTVANWTNASGGANPAGIYGSNLFFSAGATSTNNATNSASFGSVTWLANSSNYQATAANKYYFTGFTNTAGITTLWNIRTFFSNTAIAPVIYNAGSLTIGNFITNLTANAILYDGAGNTTNNATIYSATAGLTKQGAGSLVITGGTNNYAVGTTISNGYIYVGNNKALSTGTVTFAGGNLGAAAGTWIITNASYNLLNHATFDTAGNNLTLAGVVTNTGALTKINDGTLTLTVTNNTLTNTFSGGLTNRGGRLVINSPTVLGGITAQNGLLAGDRATMVASNTLLLGTMWLGSAAGASGALLINGGNVTNTTADGGSVFPVGTNGYGYVNLTSGSLSATRIQNGNGGTGVVDIAGGQATFGTWLMNSRGGYGVINVSGGTLQGPTANNSSFNYDINRSGVGLLNVMGSGVADLGRGVSQIDLMVKTGNRFSIINVRDGGTLVANKITASQAGVTLLGFDGGTLQSSISTGTVGATYLQGLTNVVIYSGGVTINASNNLITIGQALNAPTGDGVSSISLATTGGGYIGAPIVDISGGGGTGATAIAQVDLTAGSATFGQVTNILITSAGYGYTSLPTVTLTGGGATNAATINTVSTAANLQTGGLTKVGNGVLTLTGANTYGGNTVIKSGVLTIGGTSSLPGWNTAGRFAVSNNAGLAVYNAVLDADITTLLGTGNFAAGSSLGFDTTSGNRLYSGALADTPAGALGLIKLGANTLILNGANGYSGGTIIAGGTLNISNDVLGAAGGPLVISSNAALQVSGDVTLNNRNVTLGGFMGGPAHILVDSGYTLTISNNISGGGSLTKSNNGTLLVTGANNAFTGGININGGTLVFSGGSSNAVGSDFRVGNVTNTFGTVIQVDGYVNSSAGNGLLIGCNSGSGSYTLSNGTLRAVAANSRGLLLGVNSYSTGIFNMVTGVVTGNQLQVGRQDSGAQLAGGFYYQANGTAGFSNLSMAGSAANSSNQTAVLAVTNGSFMATVISGLSLGTNSSSSLYFGPGAQITLPAFPAARGAGATATLTMDGATLIPYAGSSSYMTNLTKAYIATNGVTFRVDSGKDITIQQVLENPIGQSGGLTKTGVGAMQLTGGNTYSGGTVINGGLLGFGGGALPGLGGVLINGNGALASTGAYANVTAWLGSGKIDAASAGAIALLGDSSEAIDFAAGGYNSLFLGMALGSTGTYSGVWTFNGTTYRLGGGGGVLNYPAAIGAGSNVVIDGLTGGAAGAVILNSANNHDSTTIKGGALNIAADGALGAVPGAPTANLTFSGNGSLQFANSFALNINRTITINGGATANFEPQGTTNLIPGFITGAGGLNKLGSGVLVLSGANDYAGGTTNAAGGLVVGTNNAVGTGRLVFTGGALAAADAGSYTLANDVTFNADALLGASGTGDLTINGASGDLGTGTRTLLISNNVTTINNAMTNTASLVKGGPGMLVLGGANAYGGSTTIREGTLKSGNNGAIPSSSVLFFGDGTSSTGTLDLNGYNGTAAGLVINAPGTGVSPYTNTVINLVPGRTLNVTSTANSNIVNIGTSRHLELSGGGTLNINDPQGGMLIWGWGPAANAATNGYVGLDASRLGNLTISVSNIIVGYDAGTQASRTGVLGLATNSTITASSIYLGTVGTDGGVSGLMSLGQSNTINVANFYLGYFKAKGIVTFADGLVNPVLNLQGSNGIDRANVSLGKLTGSTGSQPTGWLMITNTGASINANLDTLLLGGLDANPSGGGGAARGYFTYNDGTVNVNTVLVGRSLAAATQGSADGLLTINGGSLTINSAFVVAQKLGAAATAVTGTVNLAGGVVTSAVNIVGGGGVSALTLSSGTLDMRSNTLGAAGVGYISNLTFLAGTLRNVAEINGGLTPLIKTGAGTLTLDTANTYSGGTILSNGILAVNNPTGSGLATGTNTVNIYGTDANNGAILRGTGSVATVIVNAYGRVAPGNSVGILTMSNLIMQTGGRYDFEFNSTPTNDQIMVLGNVTISGGVFNFYDETTHADWIENGTYNLIHFDGAATGPTTLLSCNTGGGTKNYLFSTNADNWITVLIEDANFTWTGGNATESYWTSNDNWFIPPSAGSPLQFAGSNRLVNTNDFAPHTRFAAIAFSNDAGAFVLDGNTIDLIGAVQNVSSNIQTINLSLVIDNASRPVNTYSNSIIINGAISDTNGANGLIKNGAFALTLTASNSFTGGTVINGGTLLASNAFALGRGPLAITNGTLQIAQSMALVTNLLGNSNAVIDLGPYTLTFSQRVNSTFAGALTNTGGVVMDGTGVLTLSGTNTFTGTTVVNTGTVMITGANVGGGLTTINGGKFQVGDATNFNGQVTGDIVNNANLVFANPTASTYGGVISGTNGFIKAGAGVLTLTAAQGYSGAAVISNGTLQLGASDRLPTSSTLTFLGPSTSTFDLQGYNQTLSNMTFALPAAKSMYMTNYIVGANSMLTINGAANLNFSTCFTNQLMVMDMSGLGGFTYDAPANIMNIGCYTNGGAAQTNIVLLAQTNMITAKALAFSINPGNGPNYITNQLRLGQVNNFNINEVTNSRFSGAQVTLPAGGALVLRGTAGGSSSVSNFNWSLGDNNTATAMYHIFDASAGSLDAMVNQLTIGRVAYRMGGDYSSFLMGTGTLIATNMTLGQYNGSNGFVSGTFSVNGGTVQVQTITMANSYSNNGWAAGNFILSNGLLQVQSIARTSSVGPGTGTLTWVAGMISNYDATSDLNASGIYMNLVAGNDHVLHIGDGRTATLAASLMGGGNLIKTGAGLLVLGSNGTFTGDTILNAGTLQLNAPLAAQYSTISNLLSPTALQFGSATNAYAVGGILDAFDTTLTNLSGNGVTLTLGGNNQSLVYTHAFNDMGLTGGIIKAGSGDLTLTASNSLGAGSTVTGGRLLVGNPDALGTGPITLAGGKLASDGATARLFTNALSITADSAWGDAVNNGLLTFTGPINLNTAISRVTNASDILVVGTVVTNTGNGGLEKIGAGTLTFSNTLLYVNNTSQNLGGTMVLNNSAWDSASGLRINALTTGDTARVIVTNNGSLYIHGAASSVRIGYSTTANSTNILDIYGAVTSTNSTSQPGLIFRGVAGPLNIANLNAGGVLSVVNIGMDGTGGGAANNILNFNGGLLRAAANSSGMFITNTISTFVLGGGAIIDDNGSTISIGSNLQGTPGDGGLVKLGAGVQTYSGSNTYNGLTDIRAGTLTITTLNALPGYDTAGRFVVSNGAALAVYNAVSDGDIATMLGTGNFASGSSLGFDTTSGNREYTPLINDLGGNVLGVIKLGPNNLTLGTANGYSGGTLISGSGLINAANNLALGSGRAIISSGAGLALTNGILLANDLTIAGTGPSGNGALRNVDGVNTLSGTITLSANAQIQTYSGTTLNLPGIINNGGYALTIAASDNTYISGAITNTGSLIKNNAGTLALSGANTYSGGTIINSGLLLASNAAALGTGPVAITNSTLRIAQDTTLGGLSGNATGYVDNAGYALTVNQSGNSTFAGAITNAGALIKDGAGILTLTGPNLYSGSTTIKAGSLVSGLLGTTNSAGAVYTGKITNDASLTFNIASLTQFVSGTVSGSGTLNKWGAGMLVFSNANDYSGLTVVSQGVLSIHNGASLGSAGAGTVISNGARLWIRASMTNAEPLTLTGSGTTTTPGSSWGALLMNVNTGVLDLQGTVTLAGGAVINGYAANPQTFLFEQGIGGTGDLTLSASAAHNGSGIFIFNGQSSYSGNTYVTNSNPNILGTVIQLGINDGLPTTTILNLQAPNLKTNRAELVLNGFNQTLAGLVSAYSTAGAFSSTNLVVNSSGTLATLTLNVSSNLSFDGQLGGAGPNDNNFALVKTGNGTQTLAPVKGPNTYTGGTVISNGTLKMGANMALPVNSTLYADTLGNLDLAGWNQQVGTIHGFKGTITDSVGGGNLTINFSSGSQSFLGNITAANTLTLTGGGTLIATESSTFAGSVVTIVTNGSTLLMNGTHGGIIKTYGGSTNGGSGIISTLNMMSNAVYMPGATPGLGTQMVHNLTLNPGGLLAVGLAAASNGLARVDTSFAMTNALLQLNLANYSFVYGLKITVLDYTGATGFSATDPSQWFTLNDVGGLSNAVVWAQDAVLPVNGATGSNNFFRINYDDIANGGHAITLTAIPEPGTASLLGLIGAAWLVRRIRRRVQG